jgi:hypothetical protein
MGIFLVCPVDERRTLKTLGSLIKINVPGNSVRETGERMNGGAVIDDRSPENVAILTRPR